MDDRESPSPHSPHGSNRETDQPQTAAEEAENETKDDQAAYRNTLSETQLPSLPLALRPHSLLRYIQCSQCSSPLRAPLRLPCGNTLCRACLPSVHPRKGITYPADEERKYRFACPWGWDGWGAMEEGGCAGEHCLGDCGVDVLLGRLGDILEDALSNASGEESKYEGTVSWRDSKDATRRAGLQGGTLRGVYRLIKEGQFDCNASGIAYEAIEDISTAPILKRLKDAVRNELDCQVCYTLILDPLTTHCGHTFCRKCVALLLNHSDLCPVCRRKLNMPSRIQEEPMNKQIAGLMRTLIPDQVAAAQSAIAQEEEGDTNNNNQTVLPLFVGTASFPTMPIFLHIFEPRYRIMIRRIMESREHKFGMVAFNRARRRQGGLGRSQFMQHGTMMMVERFELLPDGRSLVIATGVSRFKVMKSDMVDGYHVGHIERLDDIPVSEEERREAAETLSMNDSVQPSAEGAQPERPIDAMPTQEIFDTTLDFVRKQHREGASWLHPRALLAFGNEPTDPSLFPWWFASILNVSDEDKYTVLCATSVRERLKVAAHWAKKLEAREWPTRPSISSVL